MREFGSIVYVLREMGTTVAKAQYITKDTERGLGLNRATIFVDGKVLNVKDSEIYDSVSDAVEKAIASRVDKIHKLKQAIRKTYENAQLSCPKEYETDESPGKPALVAEEWDSF